MTISQSWLCSCQSHWQAFDLTSLFTCIPGLSNFSVRLTTTARSGYEAWYEDLSNDAVLGAPSGLDVEAEGVE